jgi:hypothetical protein
MFPRCVGCTECVLQEVFERWLSAAKAHLDVVRGWQSARLLETDASAGGRLRVQFSSRLSSVVTSVHSVAALGFRIPRELDSAIQVPPLLALLCLLANEAGTTSFQALVVEL